MWQTSLFAHVLMITPTSCYSSETSWDFMYRQQLYSYRYLAKSQYILTSHSTLISNAPSIPWPFCACGPLTDLIGATNATGHTSPAKTTGTSLCTAFECNRQISGIGQVICSRCISDSISRLDDFMAFGRLLYGWPAAPLQLRLLGSKVQHRLRVW